MRGNVDEARQPERTSTFESQMVGQPCRAVETYIWAMRIWIDTDIGSDVDDAFALAYVMRHPGFELVGLSTVFGDVGLRSRIADALLAIDEQPGVVAMPGLGVPLTPRKRGVMFGHEGQGLLDDADPILRVAEESGGAERIEALGAAIEQAAPDVILAIGPLTNLGALLAAGAKLAPLAIMGGKFSDVELPGMVDGISEWNFFCDPMAAQLVLRTDLDQLPLVAPAEVTFQTALLDHDLELLATGDALCQTLSHLGVIWLEMLREQFGRAQPRVALHDPLIAALLAEPESVCVGGATGDRGRRRGISSRRRLPQSASRGGRRLARTPRPRDGHPPRRR